MQFVFAFRGGNASFHHGAGLHSGLGIQETPCLVSYQDKGFLA